MFFNEAYGFFNYNNFFAKVGQQYANFGSDLDLHDAIAHQSTQLLSATDEMGISVGAVSSAGFYGDVFVYHGSPFGNYDGNYHMINRNASRIQGYTFHAGYVLNQGQNAFYHTNGLNFHLDYIGNMADVTALKSTIFVHNAAIPTAQIPGIAAHVDYAMGQFQVMADYVSALREFNQASLNFNDHGAKPAAYSVQANYSWDPNRVQSVSLGYDGTQQAVNVIPMGSSFNLPANRVLAMYAIAPAKNVGIRVEYGYASDYSEHVGGTGSANNSLDARLQVIF